MTESLIVIMFLIPFYIVSLQGIGYTTNEQLLTDPETGRLVTDGPSSYKLPTVADVPK